MKLRFFDSPNTMQIATACVILHRFFQKESMKKYDVEEFGLTALFISGKMYVIR
jgi:hypothetical protein